METRRKLSLVLIILISVLIIFVGFAGIYTKNGNKYSNVIPDYKLASDLKGYRILEFDVSDSKDTVYYDKEGKKVDSSTVTEENEADYTKEEIEVNKAENLTKDNYNKTLKILKKRLEFLKVDQYRMDLDRDNGKITLSYEDDYPEDVKSILPMEGKLELVDSNTSDVILEYSNIKSVKTNYAQTEDGYTVYMDIKLTKDGADKIKNIDTYKNVKNNDQTSEQASDTANKFKVEFDKEKIEEVSYDDIILTGNTLRITIGSKLTNTTTVNSKLNTASVVSKLATIGKTPVVYQISAEEYENTSVNSNLLLYTKIVLAVIVAVVIIYLVVKFKVNGILAILPMLANISLFTILIRITGISISLNSIAGIAALLIVNIYLVLNILNEIKNEEKTFGSNLKTAYLKSLDMIIISLIIFAVFAFNSAATLSAMGLLLFWGWLVVTFGNLLLTVPTLKIGGKE